MSVRRACFGLHQTRPRAPPDAFSKRRKSRRVPLSFPLFTKAFIFLSRLSVVRWHFRFAFWHRLALRELVLDFFCFRFFSQFRTIESLRREHDAQIVQIAMEAGLRIAPDQWSSLLYGDTAHKSHMQSIIDKVHPPNSYRFSHRNNDPLFFLLSSCRRTILFRTASTSW